MDIPCICPPKAGSPRHPNGDTVGLRPVLGFRAALTVRNVIGLLYADDPDTGAAEILAALTENYLLEGIESWSLTGVDDKPITVTKPAIRELLLSNIEVAMTVADEADRLYQEAVMTPLLARVSNSSPPTPTTESTSATPGSDPSPTREPSKPSSITTIQTAGTETTSRSLAGVSN